MKRGRDYPRVRAAACAALLALGCTDLEVTTPGGVVAVRVVPDTVVLRVGDSVLVRAAALDATSALRGQEAVEWSSSATSVAGVDGAGLVRATGAGTATITATVGGTQGSAVAIVTGAPTTMAVSAGDGQSAAVNSAVTVPPAVLVTDGSGNPVANVPVTFAVAGGGGSVTGGGPVLTDLDGVAAAGSWILGPSPVANTLTATTGEPTVTGGPVTFTATGTVGPPSATTSSIAASPASIAPTTGRATITVTVRDSAGSTITGATVTLSATGGGNVIIQPTDTTNALGQTTGQLGSSVIETKTITATVNGSVVLVQTASVSVSSNTPASLSVTTQPGGAVSGSDFTTQPVVELRDAFGNPVGGAVTVSLASGNGTLVSGGGSLTVNTVNGVATFSGLRIRGIRTAGDTLGTGAHVLRFSSPGFTDVDSDTLRVAVSFAYNVVDIWTRGGCASGCHSFGTWAGNFGNAAFGGCAGLPRIVAGDPASSVIHQKISSATPACGGVMPTSGLMSQRQIDLVRDWILQGALDN